MKRKAFIAYLKQNNCQLAREGGSHSVFRNELSGLAAAVPRHPEIKDITCMKICKQIGIPYPGKN